VAENAGGPRLKTLAVGAASRQDARHSPHDLLRLYGIFKTCDAGYATHIFFNASDSFYKPNSA